MARRTSTRPEPPPPARTLVFPRTTSERQRLLPSASPFPRGDADPRYRPCMLSCRPIAHRAAAVALFPHSGNGGLNLGRRNGRLVNWRYQAACLHEDPELFFPIGVSTRVLAQIRKAKGVCAGCPVREACLHWALEAGVDHGVWGGFSEEERRSFKRRTMRQRAASRVPFGSARPDQRRAGPEEQRQS